MWRITKRAIFSLAIAAILFLSVASSARAQAGVTTIPGGLPDGATYLLEVPANWNGTLFLYSHGYVTPGSANPAQAASRTTHGSGASPSQAPAAASSFASPAPRPSRPRSRR